MIMLSGKWSCQFTMQWQPKTKSLPCHRQWLISSHKQVKPWMHKILRTWMSTHMNNAIHKPSEEHLKAISKKGPSVKLDVWWRLNCESPHRRASPSTHTCTLPATTHTTCHNSTKPIHNKLHSPTPSTNPQTIPTNYVKQFQCNYHQIATELPALLANTLQQYIEHQPSILGLMEMQWN